MTLTSREIDPLLEVLEKARLHLPNYALAEALEEARRISSRRNDAPMDVGSLTTRVAALGTEIERERGLVARDSFARAVIADLAIGLARRLDTLNLPPSILNLYPEAYRRLAQQLDEPNPYEYWVGSQAFEKDLRMAAGYCVPCGSQQIDLWGRVSATSILRAMALHQQFRAGLRIMRTGTAPWFRIHLDSRYLDGFHQEGREMCYGRVADLLRLRPEVRGLVGTSWYYDPRLAAISPRLAYLHAAPLACGAYLLKHGPGAIHTSRATATSRTRRDLVASGTYVPICYSLVWPRNDLLRWAVSALPRSGDRHPLDPDSIGQ